MSGFFHNLPLKKKLIVIVMLTTGAALFSTCAALFTYEFFISRKTIERKMDSLAGIIGANSTAAIAFDDRSAAQETLAALQAEPQIIAARIFRADGSPFVEYLRHGAHLQLPGLPGRDGYKLANGYLARFGPIMDQNGASRIGTIFLQSDYHELRERVAAYAGLLSVVFVSSNVLALLLSALLQRVVSTPILNLTNATRHISRERDYSIRVPKPGADEIGELIGGFNEMLEQIQMRDAALQNAYEQLDRRVRERTRELEQEIIERKHVEQSLARSLALVQATLESTADAILVVDNNGRIVRYNQKFAQMWRLPAEILATREHEKIISAASDLVKEPEKWLQSIRDIRADRDAEILDTIEFKDGRVFDCYSQPERIDGNAFGRIWSFRDVTERHRAAERLRQQAGLLDLAQDSIVVRDLEDRVLYANKAAEGMSGWQFTETQGKNARELFYTDPASFDGAKRILLRDGHWAGEMIQRTRDGRERIVQSRWRLMYDEHHTPVSVLVINTDITEKKKLEAQFIHAQRMESIGHLAGGIAHDLNNILTPILISVDLLKKKMDDKALHDLLDTIAMSAHRGSDLVRQVLNFARGLEGRHSLLQPRHIIGEVMRIVGDTFPKSIATRSSSPRDLWLIKADPTQIHQVLLNLCLNARDAMPEGGMLKVFAENVTLDSERAANFPGAKAGPYVVITVSDTGLGIAPEIRDKIFDPFFTTKEIGKGTGLGLATSIVIVKGHGGFIHLESEVGKGTSFQVFLPASVEAKAVEVAGKISEPPRGNGELVLVVDDEIPVRRIAKRALEAAGYRVITAADGREALEIYNERQQQIAAVLTDMMMPVMDGESMIRKLKSINPRVNVIATSGMVEGQTTKAEQAGASIVLRKPFTSTEVLSAIREAVEK